MPKYRITLTTNEIEILVDSLDDTEFQAQAVLNELVEHEQKTKDQEEFIKQVNTLLWRLLGLLPAKEMAAPW